MIFIQIDISGRAIPNNSEFIHQDCTKSSQKQVEKVWILENEKERRKENMRTGKHERKKNQ